MSKKSQGWSIDISLAVIIFIAAFFITFSFFYNNSKSDISSLNKEAESISLEASKENSSIGLLVEDALNDSKVLEIASQDYEALRDELRISSDFCIYFEDQDGNIIKFDNITGIGSPEINVSGQECS